MRIIRITKKKTKPVVEKEVLMVVDKIRPRRTKAKQQTNKASKDENIQK